MVGTMSFGRRTVLVAAVGLLFGYMLTYTAISFLHSQSTVGAHTVQSFVPPAPHSHGEMNRDAPALSGIQQWHDFDESRHTSMYTELDFNHVQESQRWDRKAEI